MGVVWLTRRGVCAALALVALAAPAASAVSFQAERELGRRFDLAARQQLPLISDPEVVSYVDAIGQKMARSLDGSFFDYRFAVVRDGHVNAFAVPGGYVYVHSGLLIRAASDDEVAGVLGHEIAHVHAHHLARQQEATQLLNYTTLLGVLASIVQPAVGALATAANAAVTLKYRREFEQEADYMGARYLQSAGYDPRAMLDFFQKLSDDARAQPASAPPYLLSHPLTDERLNHLEAVLRTQQWAPHERPPAGFALRRVQALARVRTEPPAEVVALYRRGLEEQPGDPTARYLFGLVCLENGQIDVAKGALEAARAGGVVAAERELGRIALRQRQLEVARDLLRRAVDREPSDAGAWVELAKTLEPLGDAHGAMAAYRRAIELAPYLSSAHDGFGLLAGRAGNQADGFYHLATAARLSGDYEKALSQYARAEPLLSEADGRSEEVRGWIAELGEFLRKEVRRQRAGERW